MPNQKEKAIQAVKRASADHLNILKQDCTAAWIPDWDMVCGCSLSWPTCPALPHLVMLTSFTAAIVCTPKILLVQLYVCYPRRQHSFLLKTSSIAPVKNGPRSARSTRYWHDNIYFFTCFGSSMQYSILWKFSRQIKICNFICQCNLNKTVKDDKWWLAETAQLWKYLSNYC